MKNQSRSFRSTLALAMITSLVLNPLYASRAWASAKELHEVCDPINNNSSGGDQAKGECAKAQIANNTASAERSKMIMYGTAAATAAVLAVTEWVPFTAPAVKAACTALSLGTTVGGMLLDKGSESKNSEVVGKFSASVNQVMSMAGPAVGVLGTLGGGSLASKILGEKFSAGLATKLGGSASQTAARTTVSQLKGTLADKATMESTEKAAKEATGQAKLGCLIAAGTLGIQATFSGIGALGATSTFKASINAAKGLRDAASVSVTKLTLNSGTVNGGGAGTNAKVGDASNSNTNEVCDSATGKEYVSCLSKSSPELSAITDNPEFLGTVENALGGKSLGDFAKGFKGETQEDAAKYIAAGLGIEPMAVSKLMDAQKQLAKDTGELDKYEAMAYRSVASNPSSHSSDKAPDFNAMMADMLKQMNPDADTKKDNAAELVFRQLDLLPAEKIEQSKDISLFARIGYRYRKNATNLEQLNWSRQANQETSSNK